MNRHRITHAAAAALAAAALATGLLVPAAGARPADVPSTSAQTVDLRMPDTRDAAREAARDGYVDLRSPDAREASGKFTPQVTGAVTARQSGADDGVSVWLGTGSGAGLVLLILGATVGVRRWTLRNRAARELARA